MGGGLEWWLRPPVHVHVLVVQITFLLFAVVATSLSRAGRAAAEATRSQGPETPGAVEFPQPVGQTIGTRVVQWGSWLALNDSLVGNPCAVATGTTRMPIIKKQRVFPVATLKVLFPEPFIF